MSALPKYIVRMHDGFALRFENRLAKTVVDAEATVFESMTEALTAVNQHGLSPHQVTFDSVTAQPVRSEGRTS